MPVYTKNKKAYFDYEILDTVEAGLQLTGNEVKALRTQSTKLLGAFVAFQGTGAYIANWHIPKYAYSTVSSDFNPERNRTLLLHKKQIDYLRGKSQETGLTIVPLSVYTKGNLIKVELGVAKGKKRHDKRETLKQRAIDRDVRRDLRGK